MTRDEAQDLFTRIGCMDPRNVACLHVVYAMYCHKVGLGECDKLPVTEAYWTLVNDINEQKTQAKAQQQVLFEKSRSAL